jgi:hypothetical protein
LSLYCLGVEAFTPPEALPVEEVTVGAILLLGTVTA